MRAGVFWLGLAVILGGIVHIAAMLVIPVLAPKSGYSRFEASIEPNTASVMGPSVPGGEPFPYSSPDAIYVICRYDIAQNPLRFTASLPDTYWSLGLYEPDGGNFYVTDSMQSATGQPDLVVRTRSQEFEASDNLTVTEASVARGLAILRIYLRDRTLTSSMKRAAANADCSLVEAS